MRSPPATVAKEEWHGLIRAAVISAGILALPLAMARLPAHAADCLTEAKAALQSRLNALPIRETYESQRDGEHSLIVLELETLARFHLRIAGAANGSTPDIELLILDGKGWSRERGRWVPFAAAAATAESTVSDEEALADQLTDGASAVCLGMVERSGRQVAGYELHLEGDQSSGNPYQSMQLYIDPRSKRPLSVDLAGQGDTGPSTGHDVFDYDPGIKFTVPK